ncbi:MAG: hypothetical protein GXY19_16025 [Phycisphaerae bacterium]|nr:hypothetical protein [Phycisphaerae bacterium]
MLDKAERLECREIAREIVKEAMIEHLRICPTATNLKILQAKIVGVAIGCSMAGAGTLFGLAKLFGL